MPGAGIRDKRMGNACLWTLINMPDGAGVPYLARLLNRDEISVGQEGRSTRRSTRPRRRPACRAARSTSCRCRRTISRTAGARSRSAPDGGAAILTIVGTADVSVSFRRADGKATASVPTELKEFKAEIAQARATAKEIEADLTTQIARLQRIWLENRDWSFADWDARYASHPLLAQLTRRLIWDGERRTTAGRPRSWSTACSRTSTASRSPPTEAASRSGIRSAGRSPEVLAWRKRLAGARHRAAVQAGASRGLLRDRRGARDRRLFEPLRRAHPAPAPDDDAGAPQPLERHAPHLGRRAQRRADASRHSGLEHRRGALDVGRRRRRRRKCPTAQAYLFVSTDQVRFYAIAGEAPRSASTAYGPMRGEAIRMEAVPRDRLLRGDAPLRSLHQRGERRQRPELDRCRRGRRASEPVAAHRGRRLLARCGVRRPQPERGVAQGGRRGAAAVAEDRRPLQVDGNFLRVAGQGPRLQDPLRLGQHHDGAGQPLPLHRAGRRRRRRAA